MATACVPACNDRFSRFPCSLRFGCWCAPGYGLPALVLAALLAADRRRILWVLNAALAALLLSVIAHSGVDDIRAYMNGQRAFYGLGNASSLYIVTGMLGVVLFAPGGKARDAASRFALGYSCLALILLRTAASWLPRWW